MSEIFVPPAPPGNDQTLAQFATRRLGPEALEKLIGPMASGVFGGNPDTMSLKSCFPAIHALEQDYGGLFKGMIGKMKEKKKADADKSGKAGPAGPGGVLTSFEGGLEVLTRSLQDAFKGELLIGCPVTKVQKAEGGGYMVHAGADTAPVKADVFVSASPAYAASGFLAGLDAAIPEVLDEILYAPMAVITFGMPLERIGIPLDGFGFLVGLKEKRKLLGTLWDSSIFPGRAPEGYGSLRSMVGGARDTVTPSLPDEALLGVVKKELADIMDVRGEPEFVKLFRHENAIPQYTVGHSKRLERLDALEKKHRGLFFAGNAFRGVGINDCVREAIAVADKVMGVV
jgi:oxygen-dependent protoporphyrinogen oxidase